MKSSRERQGGEEGEEGGSRAERLDEGKREEVPTEGSETGGGGRTTGGSEIEKLTELKELELVLRE